MLVVILKSNLLDYTNLVLTESLGTGNFNIVYNNNDDQKSIYWHMTSASLKLQAHLIKNSSISIDMIKIPVLVIFDKFDGITTLVSKTPDTDEVFFDTLHCNKSPTVMYGSIVAISKALKSSVKIENFFKDSNNNIVKMPFNKPTTHLFQMIWFTQRIGLKIYQYAE